MRTFEERRKEKEEIYQRITKYSKISSEVIRQYIFELAWDYGHSSGEYEVQGFYDELEELVYKCINEFKGEK